MRSSAILLPLLLLAGCMKPGTGPQAPLPEPALRVERFGSVEPSAARTLIVVLNADESVETRSDINDFAASAAATIPDSVAYAMLRPGYADARGNASPGERGTGTGNDYTLDRIGAVGDAIAILQRRYPLARTILVGDTGGAAIAANLAAIRPALVDGLVLVACPCTLPEWRKHMERKTPREAWEAPVTSLDPLKTAGGIAPSLKAAVIVGADDTITPIKFSRSYAEALTLRGVATDYRILPDKGHVILNDPEVLAATSRLAAALPRKR